ncbi:MAG: RND transporter, partial [Elusimicrobia bacterium]|nr:RND transporter [Elusimicrobiota bacterium]
MTRNSLRRCAPALAAVLFVQACSLGPKYRRPEVPSAPAFKEASAVGDGIWRPADPSDRVRRGHWWEIFGDARLNALEVQAAAANQTVRQAAAQYREARDQLAYARSTYFPTFGVQPSMQRM